MIEVPFNIDRAYAFTVEGSKIAQRWVGIPWAFLSNGLSPMVAYYLTTLGRDVGGANNTVLGFLAS